MRHIDTFNSECPARHKARNQAGDDRIRHDNPCSRAACVESLPTKSLKETAIYREIFQNKT